MKLTLLILSFSLSSVYGATLAQFDFQAAGAARGNDIAGASDITVGSFSGNSGGGLSSGGNAFFRSNTTTSTLAGAITDGDYFEFTVTVDPGFQMNLNTLQFDHVVSINGGTVPFTSNLAFFTDVNGFTASDVLNTSTESHNANTSGVTLESGFSTSLSASDFQGLTGTTTFRFYVYDDDNNGDSIPRIDNVILDGTVSHVPEPSATLLLGLGGLAFLSRRKRG